MAITKIAQVDVGAGGATNITFSAIPQTFTDLILVTSVRTNYGVAQDDLYITPNGNVTSNFTSRGMFGSGTNPNPYITTAIGLNPYSAAVASTSTANTFNNAQYYFPNYSLTTQNKTVSGESVTENNAAQSYQVITAGGWANTAAISSLVITSVNAASFVQYSSATLYGISKSGATGATVA